MKITLPDLNQTLIDVGSSFDYKFTNYRGSNSKDLAMTLDNLATNLIVFEIETLEGHFRINRFSTSSVSSSARELEFTFYRIS